MTVCLATSAALSLALIVVVLFNVCFEQIRTSTFLPQPCSVLSKTLVPRYCCSTQCSVCGNAYGAPSCSSFAESNAVEPLNKTCDAGYYCCSQSCERINKVQYCSCNLAVSNRRCDLSCDVCYSAKFSVFIGNRTLQIEKDFLKNGDAASGYIAKIDSTTLCWRSFDTFTFDYEYWRWAVLGVSIIPLQITVFVGTYCFLRRFTLDRDNHRLPFSLSLFIWFAVIWPLCFFTPTYIALNLGREWLTATVFMVGLGSFWAIVFLTETYTIIDYKYSFASLVIFPLVAYAPAMIWYPPTTTTLVLVSVVQTPVLGLYAFWLRSEPKFRYVVESSSTTTDDGVQII